MLEQCFSYESFVRADDRARRCRELEQVLIERMRRASAPDDEGRRIVTDLRALGHDLVSFAESDEFQHWCGSWVSPTPVEQLIVEIAYPEQEPMTVSVGFHARVRSAHETPSRR